MFNYFAASRAELIKVSWPNRRQTLRLTLTVIVFSVVFAAVLGAVDFAFSALIQKLVIKG
ncbi:preprotein translocase subunit SecE [Candidatus Saccharibacteria bacterium]|nr:preprotein translocase subunit SecE [Candidatus Saccharibacteria bacterium]